MIWYKKLDRSLKIQRTNTPQNSKRITKHCDNYDFKNKGENDVIWIQNHPTYLPKYNLTKTQVSMRLMINWHNSRAPLIATRL
jgi:hypothetical protein